MDQDIIEIYFDSIDSTQTYLKQNWRQVSNGKWVAVRAAEQTHGRGQRSNVWISPRGNNIYVTFCFPWPMDRFQKVGLFPQIAVFSLYEALKVYNNENKIEIKWVNDLYANGKKVGGVLCESEVEGNDLQIFIGIGVNIKRDNSSQFSSLEGELGIDIDVETLYSKIRDRLYYNINEDNFISVIRPTIQKHLYKRGHNVRIWDTNMQSILAEGVFEDINEKGHAMLRLDSGLLMEIISGRMEFI